MCDGGMGWVLTYSLCHKDFPVLCYPIVMPKSMKTAGGGPGSGMDVPHFLHHVVTLPRERERLMLWHTQTLQISLDLSGGE